MLSGDAFPPLPYDSEHRTLRISMKLFNRTPADLPADLKANLCSWLSHAPALVEGHIRPGCVYFTLELLVTKRAHAEAEAAGLHSLLRHLLHATRNPFWRSGAYTVQLFSQLAVVQAGVPATFEDYAADPRRRLRNPSAPLPPVITGLSAMCVVAATAGGAQGSASGSGSRCCNGLTLYGQALDLAGLEIVYR